MVIRKAVIPVAGLGTRFLPLGKILPKEFFPLVDKPVLQYIVEEAQKSGIKEIVFVNSPEKKAELDDYLNNYLKTNPQLKNVLKKRKKFDILKEIELIEKSSQNTAFSQVFQKNPLGDGHAVLQAKNKIGSEPCLVLFNDDVFYAKTPPAKQLIKVFNQYKKPVMALYRLPKEKVYPYGVVKVKKVKQNVYEIQGIVEKPKTNEAPSNLAIVGKYVLTQEVFKALEKSPKLKGELRLAAAFSEMIKKGEKIYGCELEGKWLECGNKLGYLKSNLYLSLKHPKFKKELKQFLKKESV
ncbi:MAG: UTP--glucose-1-phosphate uridylyltransferase [Candidatus Nealsonbacteria bacterium]